MRFRASLLGALRLRADSDPPPPVDGSASVRPMRSSPAVLPKRGAARKRGPGKLAPARMRSPSPPPPPPPTHPPVSHAPSRAPQVRARARVVPSARHSSPAQEAVTAAAGLRGAAAREAGVIGWYRGQLLDAHAALVREWAALDEAPEPDGDTRGVRAARRNVSDALHDYYAAAGGPSPYAIAHVLAAAEESDRRIAGLDHELVAEVRRLELLAKDVAEKLETARGSTARAAAAADVDDALIELELYRGSCGGALDAGECERLDHAMVILKSMVESSGGGGGGQPPAPPQPVRVTAPTPDVPKWPPGPSKNKVNRGRSAHAQRFSSLPPDVGSMITPGALPVAASKYMEAPDGERENKAQLSRTRQISYQRPASRSPSEPRSLPMNLDGETASSSGSSSRRNRGSVLRMRRSNDNGAAAPKRRRPSLFGFNKPDKKIASTGLAGSAADAKTPTLSYERDLPAGQRAPQANGTAQRTASRPLGRTTATNRVNIGGRMAGSGPLSSGGLKRKQSNVSSSVSSSMRSFWGLVRPPAGGPSPTPSGPPPEQKVPPPAIAPSASNNTTSTSGSGGSGGQTSDGMTGGESGESGSGGGSSASSTTESGEELPLRMVMSRTRTLRDVAEFARHMAEGEADGPPSADDQCAGELFPRSSQASFSATLYHTDNARKDAISDAGVMLTSSKIVGDGRCLFRSIARGRAVAKGEPIPKLHAEKKAADRLRARAVDELRRNKALLMRFYVIEDNFENYCERMSAPKTYAGEPELLMLAKILRTPIAVYLMLNGMYRRIQLYGKQYQGEPIRIRYCNATHYDSLIPTSYRKK